MPPHSTESLDQFGVHSLGIFEAPENLYLAIDPQSNTRQCELGFDDEQPEHDGGKISHK